MEESIIDINVDDAVDLMSVEAGEYTLRVVSANLTKPSEKGNTGLSVLYDIVGEDYARLVNEYTMFPNPNQDTKKQNECKIAIRDFYAAHGVKPPIGTMELKDIEISVHLVQKKEDDPQYADMNGFVNKIARYIAAK